MLFLTTALHQAKVNDLFCYFDSITELRWSFQLFFCWWFFFLVCPGKIVKTNTICFVKVAVNSGKTKNPSILLLSLLSTPLNNKSNCFLPDLIPKCTTKICPCTTRVPIPTPRITMESWDTFGTTLLHLRLQVRR